MPTRFTTYTRKAEGDQFRYVGKAQMLKDDEPPVDVLMFAPVISGFEEAEGKYKKTEEHTLHFICDEVDFDAIFAEFDRNA